MFLQGYNDYKDYVIKFGIDVAKDILDEYVATMERYHTIGAITKANWNDEVQYIEGARAFLDCRRGDIK